MAYFLAKTDPDTYSVADFEKEKTTLWDGVHNYAAIGFIKVMKPGDLVYIYESLTSKSIMALAEVAEDPYENKADERFSWAVKLKFIKNLTPLSLKDIKADERFKDFKLVRESRLSVLPVDPKYQKMIQELVGA